MKVLEDFKRILLTTKIFEGFRRMHPSDQTMFVTKGSPTSNTYTRSGYPITQIGFTTTCRKRWKWFCMYWSMPSWSGVGRPHSFINLLYLFFAKYSSFYISVACGQPSCQWQTAGNRSQHETAVNVSSGLFSLCLQAQAITLNILPQAYPSK